ncbi:hypothetical protein [Paucibacter soli]|uniref:hypothetical protein n=1 Tax=Paucibacter soli TaxID=3133433 RepID=UPI0030AEA8E1
MTAQALVAAATATDIATFEANGRASGALDADGFFTQDDWEFELDTMAAPSVAALKDHLDKAPVESETASFLRSYLMDGRTHFTAFD